MYPVVMSTLRSRLFSRAAAASDAGSLFSKQLLMHQDGALTDSPRFRMDPLLDPVARLTFTTAVWTFQGLSLTSFALGDGEFLSVKNYRNQKSRRAVGKP